MSDSITVDLSVGTQVVADELWQYDYGIVMYFTGVDLPTTYQVHFSNYLTDGVTVTNLGTPDGGVLIPNDLLRTGLPVYAWVYLHTDEDDGYTQYRITIPVNERSEPEDVEPTPQEESLINQAIAALNNAVEDCEEAVTDAQQSASDALGYCERAETAAENAELSESNAATSETNALTYAERAESASNTAVVSAESASESAESASESADRAEQAAATKGYIYMYISDGHLWADITDNVDVEFYQQNGHLYVTD